MKLPNALRRNQDGDPLDERIATEMAALDSALRGEQVDPEMGSLATMASDLRADREEIEGDFSARLDAWAAAGFPRGERPGARPSPGTSASSAFERLRLGFASAPPRRLIGPAFAAASVAVIAAVAISQSGDIGGSSDSSNATGDSALSTQLAPGTPNPDQQSQSNSDAAATDAGAGSDGAGSGASAKASPGGDVLRDLSPAARGAIPLVPFSKGEGALGAPVQGYSGAPFVQRDSTGSTVQRNSTIGALGSARGNNLDQVRKNRKVERAAQLSLKASAKDVPSVASRASDVTERYNGNVLSSHVTGSPESARATLELAIPTKNLDAALSDLADLAEVSSRSESSNDITRSFVTARDQLSGFRAERDSLLTRLADATTDAETADLKAKLSLVNDQVAQARGSVDKLNNRASISRVGLEIDSNGMIGGSDNSDDGWSIGDALHDAGHVLTVAGGVALISGAVLLPLALIVLIATLLIRTSRTRARERTLDE